jgi:hypothetical protein
VRISKIDTPTRNPVFLDFPLSDLLLTKYEKWLQGRIYEASSSNSTFSVWQCTFVTRCTVVCTRRHALALSAFSSAEYLPRKAMAHIPSYVLRAYELYYFFPFWSSTLDTWISLYCSALGRDVKDRRMGITVWNGEGRRDTWRVTVSDQDAQLDKLHVPTCTVKVFRHMQLFSTLLAPIGQPFCFRLFRFTERGRVFVGQWNSLRYGVRHFDSG